MSKFRDLNNETKPREKCKLSGSNTLNETELLAIILQSGTKKESVMMLSQKLIEKYNGLEGILNATYGELIKNSGIGEAKALKIRAIGEVCKKVNSNNVIVNSQFSTPKQVYELCQDISNSMQEHFVLICLDNKTRLIERKVLYTGTSYEISISPKEIFTHAITNRSFAIIIVHNHPSGDLTPSGADIESTKKITEIGKLVGIQVLDHIIVSKNNYLSIRYENNDIF